MMTKLQLNWDQTEQAAERPCKTMRYSPHGGEEEEIDNIGPNQYSREFYPNGSVSSSLPWNRPDGAIGKWLNGDSISPLKKMVSHFTDGQSVLTVWNNDDRNEGAYTRAWYFDGGVYLEGRVALKSLWKSLFTAPVSTPGVWSRRKRR